MVAVIAVEIAQCVRQIGQIEFQVVTGNQVLGVVRETEQTRALGGVGRLEVERMEVVGIDGSVAEIVNVG